MADPAKIPSGLPALQRYRYKWVLYIALSWTILDLGAKLYFSGFGSMQPDNDNPTRILTTESAWQRALIVLVMSLGMGYLLVTRLRTPFRNQPLWVNIAAKTLILLAASVAMNFVIFITYCFGVLDLSLSSALEKFLLDSLHTPWLLEKSLGWLVVFVLTQLFIEINEKYAPGVFTSILLGRYIHPRAEERIVLFLDLKDSTPIAEQLGHFNYFLFIREFIYLVSLTLLDYDGGIYQYVGDEIVCSWKKSPRNAIKVVAALLAARRKLQKNSRHFQHKFGIVPEFRAGIHVGEVTIGEIGVVKKDLAISGDTMNTAARIRTACSELDQRFVISRDFADLLPLNRWTLESLGNVELKGKADELELLTLKV